MSELVPPPPVMRYKPQWLAMVREAPLLPEQPIIDAHHHLYDDPVRNATMGRFMLDEFLAEIAASGHDVRATVYTEAYNSFLDDGPEDLRTVGETRTANRIGVAADARGPGSPRICAGIVSSVEITLGARLDAVIRAHEDAAPDRLRGVRLHTACDPEISVPYHATPGMMREPAFLAGARALAAYQLSLDIYVFHPQLADVEAVARAAPDTTIVLDHVGTPLAAGRFAGAKDEVFAAWRQDMSRIAACPNVVVKLGGMVADWCGGSYEGHGRPPSSEQVAADGGDYYRATIELFGPDRCMFVSNFPRDRISLSYGVAWNAYKRIATGFTADERMALFHDTAARVYRLAAPAA